MSLSKICSNSNLNETNGRVIIAKAHPPNSHSQNNNLGGPIQFQYNSNDGTLYAQNNSFYQSQSNNVSSDILFSSNGSYLSQPLTHTTRASPTTVQWLVDNFEPGEGCSLRRSILYSFYLQHCSEQKLESVNPASFGKLIRSVFLGLRTRRLGTRGNSKYHYYGIKIKFNSNLNIYSQEIHLKTNNSFIQLKNRRWSNSNDQQFSSSSHLLDNQLLILNYSIIIPDSSDQINIQQIKNFENSYKDHCQKLFDVIIKLDFDSVEQIWLNYWSTKEFNSICSLNYVEQFIINCDYTFYEQIVQLLIPDILLPMTGSLTQSIRSFGKNVSEWLNKSLNLMGERIKKVKLLIVNSFSMILRRYTSLNHLAQSARSVLINSTQMNQMLIDLNKVDFHSIQEQASWICECDENIILRIEKEFKNNLSCQLRLEEWCEWFHLLLNDLLKPYSNISEDKFLKKGKEILLNWSFYCSMIIRDLTLRSASSFGSFHLIRLLFDEYLFYLIEKQIALNKQTTSIEVICQLTLENKLSTSDCLNPLNLFNERANIPFLLKKDSLSQTKMLTFPNVNVQLPIYNKLISPSKFSTNNNLDSVKRFKRNQQTIPV